MKAMTLPSRTLVVACRDNPFVDTTIPQLATAPLEYVALRGKLQSWYRCLRAQFADISRLGLVRIRNKAPTLPKPIKFGSSCQAAAYYVISRIECPAGCQDQGAGRKVARRRTTASQKHW